ncbi:MAG: SDR family oxidoreductase [Pseudomonadales bacterium]|nr:SDR family oxidoreductase [Pseudomonadales bacterium]
MAAKSVVITGGTKGLGMAYATELLRRGHNVAICARSQSGVDAALAKLKPLAAQGAVVDGVVCDTTDPAAVRSLWDLAVGRFGRVDIWVNNAGYARTGASFLQTTPDDIDRMVRDNVIGTLFACDVAMAGLKRQGGGRIYLTLGGGSASGRVVANMTVYSTTKRALKYFATALVEEAKESAPMVLIGTISPGVNMTEGMLREIAAVPPEERAKVLKPLNFIGEHVETTAPWIVDRMLADTKQGSDITWLTTGRLMGRSLGMLFSRRDILSRYGLGV